MVDFLPVSLQTHMGIFQTRKFFRTVEMSYKGWKGWTLDRFPNNYISLYAVENTEEVHVDSTGLRQAKAIYQFRAGT